ncbi:hypothetical protein R3P38DRAFT_3374005 [Favolaschia claudopus]|uniref:Uncharacterized protein n=1 Tax=Favolaschia claudopus TaxID=2862362 RepID=A0AAV9ZRD4_9AGAR
MSSASAIDCLVSFLTRPLMKLHKPATIVSLQLSLRASLSSGPLNVSLLLSSVTLPPLPIQRACAVSGIRWSDWILQLSCGIDVQVFLTESSLAIRIGRMPRRIIWVKPETVTTTSVKIGAVSGLRTSPIRRPGFLPRRAVSSTRERDFRSAILNPTRIPTLLCSSYNCDDLADVDAESESDCDSLSDDLSDSGSDISDSACSWTSSESASSVTSVPSGASSRSPSPSSVEAAAVTPDVTRYKYDGGVTQVLSGGVMLGAARTSIPKAPLYAGFSKRRPSDVPKNVGRKVAASALASSWRRCT